MRALPPLTALRAFEAAARHLSFKAAADELRLTPTAISHQIRLLEKTLGRPLFRRRPRPLILTQAGAALLPVLRDGFDHFEQALASIRQKAPPSNLRVTTTNAFAARWLVPRLPLWRAASPDDLMTEVIGTDAVIDLTAGEADVAIRYSFAPPPGLPCTELLRDRFWPIANPHLLSPHQIRRPSDLLHYPLVHAGWPAENRRAPTWQRWIKAARKFDSDLVDQAPSGLLFREELHAIDAVVAGQGVGLLSDVLVRNEIDSGKLVRVSDVSLPGLGFYLISSEDRFVKPEIDRFIGWMRSIC